MFTQHIPRTGRPVGTEAGTLKRAAAFGSALALGTGLLLVAPLAAAAVEPAASYAEGQFLSGVLAGVDLATVVDLQSAEARNNGNQPTQEVVDPLAISLLGGPAIGPGADARINPDALNAGTSTDGGAISQYARAGNDGTAVGASGTVGAGGAIGPDATGADQGGALVLSLDSLIDDRFASVLADLRLEVEAVAAQAKGDPEGVSGDYFIDGLTLKFTSPVIGDVTDSVRASLSPVSAKLNELSGPDGELARQVNNVLAAINPALSLAGSSANVSATVTADLEAAVAPLLQGSYGGSGVSFDLSTGEVTLDLEALAGGDLNNKPVGYEVLSDATVTRVVDAIARSVTGLAQQVKDRVELALRNARVDIDADVSLLTDRAPLLGQVCVDAGGNTGLLGGLAQGTVGALLCTPTSTALPPLHTSASVDLHGTVQQVLDGTSPATVTAQVLGVPISVSTDQLLGVLDRSLLDGLLGGGGALSILDGLLDTQVIDPVTDGLLGGTSVDTVLSDLLSVKVNLQETALDGGGLAVAPGTRFTQTAMRVAVASGAGFGGLTTLNLAAATVVPNQVVDPGNPGCTVNCGPGGDPDPCVVNCGPGGLAGTPSTTAADRLAYTGVGIATLIAVVLALLAAGAYMAREGYRQKHPQSLT